MEKHTPTPWHTASDESDYFRCIEKDDRLIARCPSSDALQAERDAAYIVRAVNSHKELLAIVKDIYADEDDITRRKHSDEMRFRLEEAIAKAEGK